MMTEEPTAAVGAPAKIMSHRPTTLSYSRRCDSIRPRARGTSPSARVFLVCRNVEFRRQLCGLVSGHERASEFFQPPKREAIEKVDHNSAFEVLLNEDAQVSDDVARQNLGLLGHEVS